MATACSCHPAPAYPVSYTHLDVYNRQEYLPRAQSVLAELLARHGDSDDRVALVTHGGFFQSFMEAMITAHLPATPAAGRRPWWFGASNASITYIEFFDGHANVRYVNKVEHLSDDLLSG